MSVSWTTLTAANVLSALSAAEVEVCQQVSVNPGQADPLTEVLALVTARVRGYVGRVAALDTDTTKIPELLLAEAIDMAVVRLLTRVGLAPSEQRVKLYEAAQKRLEGLKTNDFNDGGASTGAIFVSDERISNQ